MWWSLVCVEARIAIHVPILPRGLDSAESHLNAPEYGQVKVRVQVLQKAAVLDALLVEFLKRHWLQGITDPAVDLFLVHHRLAHQQVGMTVVDQVPVYPERYKNLPALVRKPPGRLAARIEQAVAVREHDLGHAQLVF